jgi:twinkle protein
MPDEFDDAARLSLVARAKKRLAEIMVSQVSEKFDADPDAELVSMASMDGKQIAENRKRRLSKFGTTPFDPTGDVLRLFPGGLTIWSGYPGTGKTTLLRQFVCHCLSRKSSVFLASLEEHPEDVISGLAAVAAGTDEPSAHQIQWFIDEHGPRFRLWGRLGNVQHRKLLAVIRSLAEQGVKHAIIDSLMCLDIANDDFEAQRRFANLVADTARLARIHIHLVAHPRKLISSDQDPDINDVAGAREIGGIADNIVFVRRAKEENPNGDCSPMLISIRKQRHGSGACGDVKGWYQRKLKQFSRDQFPHGPVRYLPDDAYGTV